MTYQDMSTMYRDEPFRQRIEMCIREQGIVHAASDKAEIAALGNGCVASNWIDIDAIIAAVSVGSEGAEAPVDDEVLKEAVQSVWPVVAKARYPQLVGQPGTVFRLAASPGAMPPQAKTILAPDGQQVPAQFGPYTINPGAVEYEPPAGTDRSQEGIAPPHLQTEDEV